MPAERPTTVPSYIEAAPEAGRAHLRRLDALLREAAPEAERVIKWNVPFFVEPRFLFSFSAHKAHLGFVTTPETLAPFGDALAGYEVTPRGILKLPYARPLPEALIRRIAERRVRMVAEREDDGFW